MLLFLFLRTEFCEPKDGQTLRLIKNPACVFTRRSIFLRVEYKFITSTSRTGQVLSLRQLSTNEINNSFFLYVFLDRTLAYCNILERQSPTKFGTAPVLPCFTEQFNRFVPYRTLSYRPLAPFPSSERQMVRIGSLARYKFSHPSCSHLG